MYKYFREPVYIEIIITSTLSLTYSTYRQRFRLVRRIFPPYFRRVGSIDLKVKVRFSLEFASDLSSIRIKICRWRDQSDRKKGNEVRVGDQVLGRCNCNLCKSFPFPVCKQSVFLREHANFDQRRVVLIERKRGEKTK